MSNSDNQIKVALFLVRTGSLEKKKKALLDLQQIGDAECINELIHSLKDKSIASAARKTLEEIIRRTAHSIEQQSLLSLSYLKDIKTVEHHPGRYRWSAGEEYWCEPWDETVYFLDLSCIRQLAGEELKRRHKQLPY